MDFLSEADLDAPGVDGLTDTGHQPHVLLLDPGGRSVAVSDYLSGCGYMVRSVRSAHEAMLALASGEHALLLVQADSDVLTWLAGVRALPAIGGKVPVLVLGLEGQAAIRVACLDAGADDCLLQPGLMRELLARVRALLRRPQSVRVLLPVWQADGLQVDPNRREVLLHGRRCDFTACEVNLLCELALHAGAVVSRDALVERVWGRRAKVYARTVDAHICRIRAVIERNPRQPKRLLTARGAGYLLANLC